MLVAALVGGAIAQVGTDEEEATPSGGLVMDMKDVKFVPDELEARAGSITVAVKNSDLFWHTFTIRELNANVSVPVQAQRTLTFQAQAGTYEFICAIPGHTQAGMKGTLTVR
jgi:uncharacterized cupredoxin-like copper-binding protein